MRHQVRYHMHWGHKGRDENRQAIEITRAEYNRMFGVDVPEAPEIPEHAMDAWAAWHRLNARRTQGDGLHPISFSEIKSFIEMTGEVFTRSDIAMIEAIDDAYIGQCATEKKAMFDAMKEQDGKRPRVKK